MNASGTNFSGAGGLLPYWRWRSSHSVVSPSGPRYTTWPKSSPIEGALASVAFRCLIYRVVSNSSIPVRAHSAKHGPPWDASLRNPRTRLHLGVYRRIPGKIEPPRVSPNRPGPSRPPLTSGLPRPSPAAVPA